MTVQIQWANDKNVYCHSPVKQHEHAPTIPSQSARNKPPGGSYSPTSTGQNKRHSKPAQQATMASQHTKRKKMLKTLKVHSFEIPYKRSILLLYITFTKNDLPYSTFQSNSSSMYVFS